MPTTKTSPIHCPYFLEPNDEPCQVIALLPNGLPMVANKQLKSHYCGSGLFVGCPLFRVIQRRLEQVGDDLRRRATLRQAAR